MSAVGLQETLPGMPIQAPNYNSLELPVVRRLQNYFRNPDQLPLLTIDEDDILFESDALYFDGVSRHSTPNNALERVRSGELSNEEILRRQRAGRAIVRGEKSDMYVDRVINMSVAVDTCRSFYRSITTGEVIPVLEGDTVTELAHRTGDYVDDLFRAARETRVLKGPAMRRVTNTLRDKFEADAGVALDLTTLAAENSKRKVTLWMKELGTVSRDYERMTKETRERLLGYISTRPAEYMLKPDLHQLLADNVRK